MTAPDVTPRRREAHQVARIIGSLLLIAAPALALGTRAITNRDRGVAGRIPAPITAVDSQAYNSLIYHGSAAQARYDARWKPTGYATLGLAGTLLAIGLLAWVTLEAKKAAA